jgi:hypothetical protein
MDHTRWDHGLTVTGEGQGLVGHAGAVLLRKLADQARLTAALGSALARRAKFPLVDRGVALVSMAVGIALGATSMNDITVLADHAPVLGPEPSDTTVRRTLELADPATLDKIARVRARVRAHMWSLIRARLAGFPWLAIAGKVLTLVSFGTVWRTLAAKYPQLRGAFCWEAAADAAESWSFSTTLGPLIAAQAGSRCGGSLSRPVPCPGRREATGDGPGLSLVSS